MERELKPTQRLLEGIRFTLICTYILTEDFLEREVEEKERQQKIADEERRVREWEEEQQRLEEEETRRRR